MSSALDLDLPNSVIRMFQAHSRTGVGYLNFAARLPAYIQDTGVRPGVWTGESAVLALAGIARCSLFGEVLLVPAVLAAFPLVVTAAGGTQEVDT